MNDISKFEVDPEYACFLRNNNFSPDANAWFNVLYDALETYLCGLDDNFKIGMYQRRDETVEWVHGRQDYQYCFNEVWLMFYDSPPEFVKKVLEKRFKERYSKYKRQIKKEKNLAKNKNNGGRESETDISNSDIDEGSSGHCIEDVWIESIIFQG